MTIRMCGVRSPTHQDPCRWIRKQNFISRKDFWSRGPWRKLEVVVHQQVGDNHFNLISRKEATGTSIFAMTKMQAVLVGRGKLIFVRLTGVLASS